jgi:hypothetical protein
MWLNLHKFGVVTMGVPLLWCFKTALKQVVPMFNFIVSVPIAYFCVKILATGHDV